MNTPYYQDDLVTLYHGDCREVAEWTWLGAVLITDPPYGVDYRTRRSETVANDSDFSVASDAIRQWGDQRPWASFAVSKTLPDVLRLTDRFRLMTWHKTNMNGGVGAGSPWLTDVEFVVCSIPGTWPRKYNSALISARRFTGNPASNANPEAYLHPTQKPVPVMGQVIAAMPDGVVADPFAGSGSTLVAAKHLGRRAVGVELDERYCEVTAKRLTQDTLFGGAA